MEFPEFDEKEAGPAQNVDTIEEVLNLFFTLEILLHLLVRTNSRREKRIEKRWQKQASPSSNMRGSPKTTNNPSNPEPSYIHEISLDELKTCFLPWD